MKYFTKLEKFLNFSTFILFFTLIVILFTIILIFNIHPFFDYLPDINYNFLNFDNNLFSKIPLIGLLTAIVGALSAITAIIFSLTIISIENVSQKYTPYILDKFIRNSKITRFTLYGFIFIIITSLSLLLINNLIEAPTVFFYLLFIIIGFTTCFMLLIKYFYFIFDIINPIKFSNVLKEKVIKSIKKNDEEEAGPIITTMGDITIKSLERNDKNIARQFLEDLKEILYQSIYELNNLDYFNVIMDSYQRILEYCIEINSELKKEILDEYAKIPTFFMHLPEKFKENIFLEYNNYLNKLFFANKEVINKNDFDLFKSEIDSITLEWVNDPKKLIEYVKIELLFIDLDHPKLHQNNEIKLKIKHLNILIEDLEKKFNKYENYKIIHNHINELFSSISIILGTEYKEKIDYKYKNIINHLFQFYIDANFHNTFLIIGAYCLFAQKEKGIESDKYFRELWLYTNPDDARGMTANKVPVTSDIKFLLNMLFWGGGINDFWYDRYYFGGFHGSKDYLYTYFILLLTHLRERQNQDLTIQISKEMDPDELNIKYLFMKKFILESEELVIFSDNLIQESNKWTFLFPTKKQRSKNPSQNEEDEIIDLTTKEQFENTKNWIENKKREFEDKINNIEIHLPVNFSKVEECKKQILKSFKENSEIDKVVSFRKFNKSKDSELKFIKIYKRPQTPKHCFLATSSVDCSMLWLDFGRIVAFGEINYVVKQILENLEIQRIEIEDIENLEEIYNKIESTVNSLRDKGFNPSTIFLPLIYFSKLWKVNWKKDDILYGKFSISNNQFKFNDSNNTKLNIIHSSDYTEFDDIIILDKNACIWTYESSSEDYERLYIEINEHAEDKLKIDITVKTSINLKIEMNDAIKILLLKKNI